jgi:hypothetical protein
MHLGTPHQPSHSGLQAPPVTNVQHTGMKILHTFSFIEAALYLHIIYTTITNQAVAFTSKISSYVIWQKSVTLRYNYILFGHYFKNNWKTLQLVQYSQWQISCKQTKTSTNKLYYKNEKYDYGDVHLRRRRRGRRRTRKGGKRGRRCNCFQLLIERSWEP